MENLKEQISFITGLINKLMKNHENRDIEEIKDMVYSYQRIREGLVDQVRNFKEEDCEIKNFNESSLPIPSNDDPKDDIDDPWKLSNSSIKKLHEYVDRK